MGRDAVCHRELQDESSSQVSRKPWGQSCTSATRAFLAGLQAERDLGPWSKLGPGRERLTVRGSLRDPPAFPPCVTEPLPLSLASLFLSSVGSAPGLRLAVRTVSLAPRWPSAYWTPQVCAPCGERTLPAQQASQRHGAAGFAVSIWILRTLEQLEAIITLTSQL